MLTLMLSVPWVGAVDAVGTVGCRGCGRIDFGYIAPPLCAPAFLGFG